MNDIQRLIEFMRIAISFEATAEIQQKDLPIIKEALENMRDKSKVKIKPNKEE